MKILRVINVKDANDVVLDNYYKGYVIEISYPGGSKETDEAPKTLTISYRKKILHKEFEKNNKILQSDNFRKIFDYAKKLIDTKISKKHPINKYGEIEQ